jgi:hypothetical protein
VDVTCEQFQESVLKENPASVKAFDGVVGEGKIKFRC